MMWHGLCYNKETNSFRRFRKLNGISNCFSLFTVNRDGSYGRYEHCDYPTLIKENVIIPWGVCKSALGEKHNFYIVGDSAYISQPIKENQRLRLEDTDPDYWINLNKQQFENTYSIDIRQDECYDKETHQRYKFYFDYLGQQYVIENHIHLKKIFPSTFVEHYETDPEKLVTQHCVEEISKEIDKKIAEEVEKIWNGNVIKIQENELR